MQDNYYLLLATIMFIGCPNSWGQDEHAGGASSNFSLTVEQLATLESNPHDHPVILLNLLRFKPDGGKSAYFREYGAAVMPLISEHGGKVIFDLEAEQLLIGEEQYDRVILVMYPSVEDFTKMILSGDYQKISHHRTDAIEVGHLYGFSNAAEELKALSEQK